MPRTSKLNRQSALTPEDAERAASELYERQESGKVRKRPDSTANVDKDDNARYISLGASLMMLEPTNMDDPEQVRERIAAYLQLCTQTGVKPSVAGLALAFGQSRQRISEMMNGKRHIAHGSLLLLERAYQFLNMQLEAWMNDNKINAVAGIFQCKANFGYQDTQRIELCQAQDDTILSPEELNAMYQDAVSIDFDE